MPRTLMLPALVAGRDLADTFVDHLAGQPGDEVVVDARELVSGTSSFAAQLVQRVLVDDGAHRLVLLGPPENFAGYAREAAAALSVADRLDVQAPAVMRAAAAAS